MYAASGSVLYVNVCVNELIYYFFLEKNGFKLLFGLEKSFFFSKNGMMMIADHYTQLQKQTKKPKKPNHTTPRLPFA